MTTILGVKLDNRVETASKLQEVLTKYGCSIKTRLGIHGASCEHCETFGIIILDIIDDKANDIADEIGKIDGAEVQKMVF